MKRHQLQYIIDRTKENQIFDRTEIIDFDETGNNAKVCFSIDQIVIEKSASISVAIQPKDIPRILKKNKADSNLMVIAQYLTGDTRKKLYKLKISYLDSVGNCLIIGNDNRFWAETGNSGRAILTKSGDRAFGKAGLKVVYFFLTHSEGINYSYRKIKSQTNVAIDTIGKVIKQLLTEGYLVKKDEKKYLFRNRPTLFDKWVEEYNRVLRPKLIRSEVGALEEIDWDNPRKIKDSSWGGVVAYNKANKAKSQLIVDKAILYTKGEHFDLMSQEKLMPRNNGPIILYTAFWNIEEGHGNYVHPFLVYADLINSNDPRQIEVAQEIYEKEIEPQL